MRRFVVLLALTALVVSGIAVAGQGKREDVANKVRAELKKIDARLKLTPDQKTQVSTLLTEQSDKLDALYAEIEPRETALRSEYKEKIRGVLTPAQQTEWAKIKSEYKQNWEGKGKSK